MSYNRAADIYVGKFTCLIITAACMGFLGEAVATEPSPKDSKSTEGTKIQLPNEFVWVTAALDPLLGSARRIKLVRGPGDGVAIIEQPGRTGSDGINEVGDGPPFNPRHSPLINAELVELKYPDPDYRLFDLRRTTGAGPQLRLSLRRDGLARLLVLDDDKRVSRVITLEPLLPNN